MNTAVAAAEPEPEPARAARTSTFNTGGALPAGLTSIVNTTGCTEQVMTVAQLTEHIEGTR